MPRRAAEDAVDARPPPSKKVKRTTPTGGAPPLGKYLASSEKPIRDKAVASLTRFLSAGKLPIKANNDERDEAEQDVTEELVVGDLDWDKEWDPDSRLEPLEMAKLWKGIYYCFWMSDKPLVQQALAQQLADLTLVVRPKSKKPEKNGRVERVRSAVCFLKGFWETVCREWPQLDRLRIDKFYMLIRRFVNAALRLLEREEWDLHAIELYNEVLTSPGGPLHVESPKTPHSLTFHVADVFLDELERVASSSESSSPSIPLVALLRPYFHTLTIAPSSPIFARIIEQLVKPLLVAAFPPVKPAGRRRKKDGPPPPRPEYPAIIENCVEGKDLEDGARQGTEVAKKVLRGLFSEGGKPDVDDNNRRKIYQFVAEWDVELE
ncbi:hypothetical protein JCM10212_002576 [Sporobolomyces blumeae]